MIRRLASLLTLLPLLTGCDNASSGSPSNLPTVQIPVGSKIYTLEIAAKEADRNHGLMQRDSMPANHGMIFVFAAAHEQGFWMKNTRIPLDILYLDSTGKIVSIHHMDPYKLNTVPSQGDCKFAIELNGDQAKTTGIKPGDTIALPDSIKKIDADP